MTAIYNEMEEEVPSALAGDNIRIRLRGVEEDEVQVGFVLSDTRKPVHAVTQFQAQLVILEHKNIICAGYGAVLHVHTMAEEVTLTVGTTRSQYSIKAYRSALTRRLSYITLTKRLVESRRSLLSSQRKVRENICSLRFYSCRNCFQHRPKDHCIDRN